MWQGKINTWYTGKKSVSGFDLENWVLAGGGELLKEEQHFDIWLW